MANGRSARNLLARIVAAALGAVVLGVAFVFSLVVFAVALAAGVLALGYFWWKTRSMPRPGGRVIEGESRREDAPRIDRNDVH
jgi:hypothetical protein